MCQVWCSSIAGIYSQLEGLVCHGYLCIVLYMKLIWCHGFAEIYALLERGQSAIGICALFYIYRSAMRCAKFGIVVCKTSMVNCRGAICHG